MIVIEAKLKGTASQYAKIDEAIRTSQFVSPSDTLREQNKCLRHWMDNKGVTRNDLQSRLVEPRTNDCVGNPPSESLI